MKVLPDSGVAAGSYTKVTVNEKGIVTAGENPQGSIKDFTNTYGGTGTFTRTFTIHNCYSIILISGSGKVNSGAAAAQRWVDGAGATQGNITYSLAVGTLNADWVLTLTGNGSAVGSANWTTFIQGNFSSVDVA